MNRNFLMIDKEKKYIDIAKRRVWGAVQEQVKLL